MGHGRKSLSLTDKDYDQLVHKGARWSIEQGYGFEIDLENMESHGFISGGDIQAVSKQARERGSNQLGSIGSGNHFVEIGEVQTILLSDIAQKWGVAEGQIYVLIHSGSRGFGHQICQDTLNTFIKHGYDKGLPDRQLVSAPIHSSLGQQYFKAMAAAANFAFNNRQQILHYVRKSFEEILGVNPEDVRLIYDVCHNIAKFETHEIEGKKEPVRASKRSHSRFWAWT